MLFDESASLVVLHVHKVVVNEVPHLLRGVPVRLLDLRNRSHLLDGILYLVLQLSLFGQHLRLSERCLALLRPVEWLERLEIFTLDHVIDRLQLELLPFGIALIDFKMLCGILVELLPLQEVGDVFLPVFVPLMRVDTVANEGQPLCVVVNVVQNLGRIRILQVCPHILMVEDQVDLPVLTSIIWPMQLVVGQQMLVVSRLLIEETLRSLFCEEVIAFCSGSHSSVILRVRVTFLIYLSALSELLLSVFT